MKRIWIFVGVGLLLLLLFAWWYSQHEWLSTRLLAQIKPGMKKDQVEALLGEPEKGYKLASWNDYYSLIEETSPITLIAPKSPWLPTLISTGLPVGEEKGDWPGMEVVGPARSRRNNNDPFLETPWVWLGRERALVLLIDEEGVRLIRVFTVNKTGGGFFSWLSRKWEDWLQGK